MYGFVRTVFEEKGAAMSIIAMIIGSGIVIGTIMGCVSHSRSDQTTERDLIKMKIGIAKKCRETKNPVCGMDAQEFINKQERQLELMDELDRLAAQEERKKKNE